MLDRGVDAALRVLRREVEEEGRDSGVGEVGGDAGAHGSGSEDGYTSDGSHGCSDGNGSRVARDLTKVIDQHNVAALLVELRPQEPALIGRHGKAETWTLVERHQLFGLSRCEGEAADGARAVSFQKRG